MYSAQANILVYLTTDHTWKAVNAVDQQERLMSSEAEAHLREVIGATSHKSAANTV